jgi:hypothetical protein
MEHTVAMLTPMVAAGGRVGVSPRSVAAAFTRITDPRRAASVPYPLAAVLRLAVVAILATQRSVLAIARGAHGSPPTDCGPGAFLQAGPPVTRRCSDASAGGMGRGWRRP